ncbi:MAG: hypothetical protein GX151_07210 [Gammaproteobacteria bacterium]|jgi:flagellar basal body-associated protein FliL|nr:hypothetical protein [Gammaproteobacteria bacterium]
MSRSEQQSPEKKPSLKKMILLASLGLLIPIFLVSMAFLAVNSDAKNQEKYKQQQAEMIARIEAREAAEKQAQPQQASQTEAASEVAP